MEEAEVIKGATICQGRSTGFYTLLFMVRLPHSFYSLVAHYKQGYVNDETPMDLERSNIILVGFFFLLKEFCRSLVTQDINTQFIHACIIMRTRLVS